MSARAAAGRQPRFWPAIALVLLAAAALVAERFRPVAQRQDHVVAALKIGAVTGALLLLWLLCFSRLALRTRLVILAAVVLVAAGFGVSIVRVGVTGDVVPLFAWRWSVPEPPPLPPPAPRTGEPVPAEWSWPQFLGPDRNAIVPGPALARDWSSAPPREVWRRPVGAGWSGFAVAAGIAVTQEQRGAQELVTAYELTSGRPLWAHAETARHEDGLGGLGPRATPAIAAGVVYALGATGVLVALGLDRGERLWSRNVVEDAQAEVPTYGVAASPLVLGERVVVLAGGSRSASLVAYDRRTGERAWGGGSDAAAYSSPFVAQLAGRPQIVVFTEQHVVGHDPADGAVLWEFPWPGDTQRVAQPVALGGDLLLVSSGYGVGSKLLELRPDAVGHFAVVVLWESQGLKAKLSNFVHREGIVYGLDDGILVALDTRDGSRRWKAGRYGHGQLVLVGDVLLIQAESGDVALVEATPDGHRELGRVAALDGKTWNSPAVAGPYLLVRNDREAACYRLPLPSGSVLTSGPLGV